MEVNYLGWNLLNGQLEIGFLCLWGDWGVYIPLQITEFWLKVFSLSQKSKINVLGEKSVCFRQALIAFWNKKRRKNICLLLVDRKKKKEWSTECGNERRIIVDMSVKIFFFKQELSFSCLSLPTSCSPWYFHFPWQDFHWWFLQLDIPHFCLLPRDKYWLSYSPGSCWL